MVKNIQATIDGESHDVAGVEEVTELLEETDGDHDDVVAIRVRYTGEEWVATVADPGLDYEGRAGRKWGAIRELVETVDERAERFGF